MNRKKQGSLTGRTQRRTQGKSLDTGRENSRRGVINNKILQKQPSCQMDDLVEFIESYFVMKHIHKMNSNSQNIYQQQTPSQTQANQEDQQFFFDVDLGVPYVQSHHLDSGFEYDDKSQQAVTMNTNQFPKVSTAKEIFTSVLQLDNTLNSQCLQQQNFTDQEDQSQSSFYIKRSADFNKKKSRKQNVTVTMDQYSGDDFNHQSSSYMNSKNRKLNKDTTVPGNSNFFNQSIQQIDKQQSIVERLKSTVMSRENKLEYWNQRLIQLDDNKSQLKANSMVSPSNQFRSSYVSAQNFHNKSPSVLSNLSALNKEPTKKKSKFQRLPIKKVTPIVLQVNLNANTNKQNITPSRLKLQPKNSSCQKAITTVTKEKNAININKTETNQKILSHKDKQHLHKDNSKNNLSKDRSFVRKVF